MELTDTHCHIHISDYQLDPEDTIVAAREEGVTRLLCVGCTLEDSRLAIEFAQRHDDIWATIGLHPHEAAKYEHDHQALQAFRDLAKAPKVVAIGETGLDYYYNHSPAEAQKRILQFQLEVAAEYEKGRLLFVGTTNLDARRGVIWNMTRSVKGSTRVKDLMN